MPTPKQPEEGTKRPYQARYGVNTGPCIGLNLAHDRSTLADTELANAINARVHDGIVINRWGQELVTSSIGGLLQGMIEIRGTGARLVLASNEHANPPASMDYFDENVDPNYITLGNQEVDEVFEEHPPQGDAATSWDDSRARYAYVRWGGYVCFQDASTKDFCKLLVPDVNLTSDIVDNLAVEHLFPLQVPGEANPFDVASMLVVPGTGSTASDESLPPIFFGTLAGGIVVLQNGVLKRVLADGALTGRTLLFQYNNRVYAAGRGGLKYQSDGWSRGGDPSGTTWTAISLPAGPTTFLPMAGTEWGGYGWLGGFDYAASPPVAANCGYLLKIDDSTGTPVVTVALNAYGSDYLQSVDEFAQGIGNTLFVSFRWRTLGGTFFASIAPWTGSALGSTILDIGESSAGIPRMAANYAAVYACGWSDANGIGLFKSTGGASATQIVDLQALFGDTISPYDMVML